MHPHHRAIIALSLLSIAFFVSPGVTQEPPKPEYALKEDVPRTGTRIRREEVTGPGIALNRTYAQLSQKDKENLHSWWEDIPAGDEPPFPVDGLRAVLDPLRKAHNALLVDGALFVVATVGADGKVVEARVFESPSKDMANFAAQLLLLTTFKPAVCSGQPCEMEFPVRMRLKVSRM